jgi:hypothetical protein
MADVPFPLGSRTIPGLSYKLLTATAHNWTPAVIRLTHYLTNKTKSKSKLFYDGRFTANQFSWRQAPWDSWPEFFSLRLNHYDHSPYGTSSLMRRWVSLLWICLGFRQVYVSHIQYVIENSSLCTIYVFCQYRSCKADHAYLVYIMRQRQFSHLNGR